MHGVFVYVLSVSGLLVLVSFLPPLATRLRLPYTVLLAAVGVTLGLLLQGFSAFDGLGPISDFVDSLAELEVSSETLLYLFLPVLLFETALAVQVRRLMDDIAPILMLAVVAVLVCTFAVGYALYLVSPLALVPCLLLGSILATTDPAAVIGVFRDLGAPRRLTMLVEGESLLNDAAAIALFTLLLGMLTYRTDGGVVEAATSFLVSFTGGALVGFVLARIACVLVAPVQDQPLAEITMTVALAYLCFVVADHYVGVSGVVAVVTAALVIGSVGRTRISPTTWGALEHVWRQLGFWANSMIFLMTALVVPRLLSGVGWEHLFYLLVIVAAALAARAVVLFGMLPVLSAFGAAQRVSHAYKAVMLWGGLRGAVSLTLALAVTENYSVPDGVQSNVAILVVGFVFFSLFVNGTTLRPLIHLLGLDRLSPVEHAMRNRALALSLTGVRERVVDVANRYQMDPAAVDPLVAQYGERIEAIDRERQAETALSDRDRVAIGLAILVSREEELYYQHFKEGIVSRAVVEFLASRAVGVLDAAKGQGAEGYRRAAEAFAVYSRWMRFASWLHRRFGIHGPLARRLSMRFEMLVAVRMVLGELLLFTQTRLAQVFGPGIAAELEELLRMRQESAERALAALKLQYPEYAVILQNQYLGRAALRLEEADFRAMHTDSIISQEILNDLERGLSKRRNQVEKPPKLDLRLDTAEMVAKVPMFAGLPTARLAQIGWLLKPRLYLPDDRVVRRGDRGDAMFFIASGAVEVMVPGLEQPIKLGSGDFFGEMALLTRQPRNADVRALGYCQVLVLDERDFRRMVQRDPELRAHIQAVAERRKVPAKPAAAAE